jgi:hypothetical protein
MKYDWTLKIRGTKVLLHMPLLLRWDPSFPLVSILKELGFYILREVGFQLEELGSYRLRYLEELGSYRLRYLEELGSYRLRYLEELGFH